GDARATRASGHLACILEARRGPAERAACASDSRSASPARAGRAPLVCLRFGQPGSPSRSTNWKMRLAGRRENRDWLAVVDGSTRAASISARVGTFARWTQHVAVDSAGCVVPEPSGLPV